MGDDVAFKMTECGPTLTRDAVVTWARQHRISLPDDYKEFLREYNGGRPDPSFFPIREEGIHTFDGVQVFFGIGRRIISSNLDWNLKVFRERIPNNLLPIAVTGTGDLLCLSVGGGDEGAVFFWDHNNEHLPPSYDNVYFITASFKEFLNCIHFRDLSAEVAKIKTKLIKGPH